MDTRLDGISGSYCTKLHLSELRSLARAAMIPSFTPFSSWSRGFDCWGPMPLPSVLGAPLCLASSLVPDPLDVEFGPTRSAGTRDPSCIRTVFSGHKLDGPVVVALGAGSEPTFGRKSSCSSAGSCARTAVLVLTN